ncbi:hypothetical protein FOZ63_032303, partial [Perkinsus olseni]
TTCMWSKSCECVALGECPSGDPEGGWRSALIVRLLNTELADRPVRYDRKPHVVGGDPVSMEDSGIELIPQRSNLPDTVIWRLPKYRNSGVRSQFAALAPVIDGDVRMVGSPGLTAKSEGGQMLMSRDAANLIDVATDCSHGNVIEFLKNFKESCSMRAIVRFTRMATIAFGVVIILLAWTAFGCTTGYRRKLRRDAKLSRQRLEALRANMPAKVEAGEATSPQGSDRGSGGDGVDGGAAAEGTSEEEESSEYDSDEDYSDYSSEEESEEEDGSEEGGESGGHRFVVGKSDSIQIDQPFHKCSAHRMTIKFTRRYLMLKPIAYPYDWHIFTGVRSRRLQPRKLSDCDDGIFLACWHLTRKL